MIRPFSPADRDGVLGLLTATGNFTSAELEIATELLEVIADRPGQRDYLGFVDEVDGRLGGMLIIGPVPATTGTWHVYWIAVHPDWYGMGAAQRLDACAEDVARTNGGYWLLAETSGQPGYVRARCFYAKQGYGELARIPDYYKLSDDLVLFGKRLT